MATQLDTTHLRNVGEFFSQHYLSEVLAGDLRDLFKRWKAAEAAKRGKSPEKLLSRLSEPYFNVLAQVSRAEPEAVVDLSRGFHASLLQALGYQRSPVRAILPDDSELPLALSLELQGKPFLWVGEAAIPASEDAADPLASRPIGPVVDGVFEVSQGSGNSQIELPSGHVEQDGPLAQTRLCWRELLDGPVLRQDHAPRWVMLLAGPDVFLIDRDKWGQGKYLHIELGAMLGHRKPAALRAAVALLHRDVLVPEGGRSVLDEIDEKSYKHAFAVSTDLKHGVQEAIELIGNEALYYRRFVAKQKTFEIPGFARELSGECITYLYRLLMLFYVEARGGELGVVPMHAEPYREGLSLESLRALELVPLATKKARDGTYFHQTLQQLFSTVHLGWPRTRQKGLERLGDTVDLQLEPQRSPLFDPANTPILSAVKLRNHVLQQVICLLSLSREGGRSSQRGRISYAQLGINQLGAVYEGLLSYTGFFAEEQLFELQNPKDKKDEDARIFYVPASQAAAYRDNEFRRTKSGAKISHPKGTFLFRLAGRDRERSASFYTPEVLTRCLTKYTLRERLGDSATKLLAEPAAPKPGQQGLFADADKLCADEILKLTVCEPAMGSGAFLGEAVHQLATAYLAKKTQETGEQIASEDYEAEHARVRYHFVAHNCYGVDLNPLATELGKVSLWLGVLQPGVQAPFVDLRLRVGNSLVGARREVFAAADLLRKPNKKTKQVNWLERVPKRVVPGKPRPKGSVYHFLVPDAGMAPYESDKVVRKLCPGEIKKLRAWRRDQCTPFTELDLARLEKICTHIDGLWAEHGKMRARVLQALRQPVALWGQPKPAIGSQFRWKPPEECANLASELTRPGSPYLRLRAVMDLWCQLWVWPIEQVAKLPTREQWLAQVEELLTGPAKPPGDGAGFVHWELEFCEVFEQRGGFDVMVGNPPWIKLQWKEAGILGDLEPSLEVRKHSAKQVADKRAGVLANTQARSMYLEAFCEDVGVLQFLNAKQNYPLLQGVQTNLYKCFMVRCWGLLAAAGVQGLLHQTGIFEDPRGGALRNELSKRAAVIAVAQNQLTLFAEVTNQRNYAWTVTCGAHQDVRFVLMANVLHPSTFDKSFEHDGIGPIPGIKDDAGNWDLRPHQSRLVPVDEQALKLFAELYDKPGTPALQARLPVIHSRELLGVLRKFAEAPKLQSLVGEYFCTQHHNETGRQKDGTIVRENRLPSNLQEWIVSGPHFYVGTPFNKSPKEECRTNSDYASIDLTQMPSDYLPRTNYVPGFVSSTRTCTQEIYRKRAPRWNGLPTSKFFRYAHREMVSPTGERTLASAILPPEIAHVNTVFGIAFSDLPQLVAFSGMTASLVLDFFVKSTGMGHINKTLSEQLPLAAKQYAPAIIHRTLRLNCLTNHYADLWNTCLPQTLLPSANPDPRCAGWELSPRTWTWDAPLRTPYARRQALVELDALAALSLGLTVAELQLIYRVQFPVLRQYEAETFYDRRGKIVFTVNRGLSGVGVTRKQWAEICEAQAGDELPDFAADAGGPFEPPFDCCEREADMARAYAYFAGLLAAKGVDA